MKVALNISTLKPELQNGAHGDSFNAGLLFKKEAQCILIASESVESILYGMLCQKNGSKNMRA